jgi:hypothetical protein
LRASGTHTAGGAEVFISFIPGSSIVTAVHKLYFDGWLMYQTSYFNVILAFHHNSSVSEMTGYGLDN